MANVSVGAYYGRRAGNWSIEEAAQVPVGMPRWMWRIEQAEQRPVKDILAESARINDYSLTDYANEWNIPLSTLRYWCRKWGIQFRREKAPGRYRSYEAPNRGRFRQVDDTTRQARLDAVLALIKRLGSQSELARQLNCRLSSVNNWVRGHRPVPDTWWQQIEALSQQDTIPVTPRKVRAPNADNHPWRAPLHPEKYYGKENRRKHYGL